MQKFEEIIQVLSSIWQKLTSVNSPLMKWGPLVLSVVGILLYVGRAVYYAFTQRSIIDEGLYLYKGYLFVQGIYTPFQDYGFWTQKAPLSYLVYGWIQQLFAPGLRTGRFFSILIGLLTILGLILVAQRIGGRWWGVVSVWVVALNPVTIRYFSVAMSQSLVACCLIWMLFFTLGEDRPLWQVASGGLLAGIMVMTRQNMVPVLVILILYLFWQRGWKMGMTAAAASLFPLIIIHTIYWPEILKMWTPWLPAGLTPFLDTWRLPLSQLTQVNDLGLSAKIQSVLEGFRFHFVALTGGLLALLLWPGRTYWKNRNQSRKSFFLMALFLVLLGFHLWAGLGYTVANNNNAFTFNPYLAFFDFLGFLVFVSISPSLGRRIPLLKQILVAIFLLVVSAGIGFGGFGVLGDDLATLQVPRVKDFFTTWKFLPGKAMLWQLLYNKFGIKYETSRLLIPTVILAFSGLFLILLSLELWMYLRRKSVTHPFAAILVTVFLSAGIVYASTPVLGGGFQEWNCTGNVIESYEQAGQYLASVIPSQSQVYWNGSNAVAVLLYVPEIRIFPPQFDGAWNFSDAGDADDLARFGFWNSESANRWREEADVFLLQERDYLDWKPYVNTEEFNEPPRSTWALDCAPNTYFRVFIREP
ncbi:MAG: glycosyltransferase family 39 protein [Chloroflexota bacterium]